MTKFSKFRSHPSAFFADSDFRTVRNLGPPLIAALDKSEFLQGLLESPASAVVEASIPGLSCLAKSMQDRARNRRRVTLARADWPKVSVIMAAYNAEATIGRSLTSLLKQTYSQLEILVVDDASRDETVRVVEQIRKGDDRVRLLMCEKNGGAATARNLGLRESQGEYIAFLDADDSAAPERIEWQLSSLLQIGALVSVCNSKRVTRDGDRLRVNGRRFSKAVISMLFPRDPVLAEIGYMLKLTIGEDSEYFQRAIAVFGKNKVNHLFETLLSQEFSPGSLLFSHGTTSRMADRVEYQQADEMKMALDEALKLHEGIRQGTRSPYVPFAGF